MLCLPVALILPVRFIHVQFSSFINEFKAGASPRDFHSFRERERERVGRPRNGHVVQFSPEDGRLSYIVSLQRFLNANPGT